ncbi:bacillithiol biosynthesis deacetylase BshB2 [Virgibacillus alimentarius]|uniref:Bacillithiol biosynthesis deacetylase BshB2 n=1 Tax=Virgibacillus alimentarius TaxID=698769 RepID=A0ABS4S5P6_9BACI|nr:MULTISPECIES: bacillithiol biosynthesis deacetylase BshB2 [Virgibacillus]MBP2256814.1 bacillithiol biosynthesis deacetylase BshB2 [Virgibacillus alimentarius]HLR65683.1 bacillithiol biosynthesis deacetylase BshB2 [Virgibacillus sp.]
MEKHVVVIYPHPDDESFGAAGTISKFRKEGVPVTYLCGTLGEMGRNMGSPIFANRETLPKLRKKELVEACKILDIDLRLLGYRDKTIEYEDKQEVARHIKGVLEEINPSLVITHYPNYAVHPDHNALGAATIEAVGMMDADTRPTVWAQAISHNFEKVLGEPDICIDMTDNFDEKMKAIVAHQSQASGIIKAFYGDTEESRDLKEAAIERLGKERFYIWDYPKSD